MQAHCDFPVIPVRAEESDKSEQVTQLLFGEPYEILERKGSWIKIRGGNDGYEGWISANQNTSDNSVKAGSHVVTRPWEVHDGHIYPMGAEVSFHVPKQDNIVAIAMNMLGSPYMWGGRTFFGVDCSGLVQVVFKAVGIALPRDAWQQEQQGEKIRFEDQRPGDLAYFTSESEKVTHVGIIVEPGRILHASGHVRVDDLTTDGIMRDGTTLTHKLYSLRRIIQD